MVNVKQSLLDAHVYEVSALREKIAVLNKRARLAERERDEAVRANADIMSKYLSGLKQG